MLGPRANVILANPNGIRVNGLTVRNRELGLDYRAGHVQLFRQR